MPVRGLLLLFILCLACVPAIGQAIRGEVADMDDKQPIAGVSIENIHTSLDISTFDNGTFLIAASGGQLLEFRKPGYKTVRVRIPQGYIPSYFKIIMKKGISEIKDMYAERSTRYDYTSDSIRYHELYKHELDFPKMSGIDVIASPFSAMSGKNREIWAFQEDFDNFEKEKYVDKTFNEAVITRFTGLKGDSLRYFMRRYRPTYQQLKSMNDYTFYNFIKVSAQHYRNIQTPRGAQ
jgi:hypothetical protein